MYKPPNLYNPLFLIGQKLERDVGSWDYTIGPAVADRSEGLGNQPSFLEARGGGGVTNGTETDERHGNTGRSQTPLPSRTREKNTPFGAPPPHSDITAAKVDAFPPPGGPAAKGEAIE